jgi:hypothetical protein
MPIFLYVFLDGFSGEGGLYTDNSLALTAVFWLGWFKEVKVELS